MAQVRSAPDSADGDHPAHAAHAVQDPAHAVPRNRVTRALKPHVLPFLRELLIVIVGALIVSSVLRLLVGQVFDIPSISMEPTLTVGDRVVVEKISAPERGDIVVFHDPGGWLPGPQHEPDPVRGFFETVGLLPPVSSDHVMKRIVGMPGDRVICCDGRGSLVINGVAVVEPWLSGPASSIRFDVVVPAGHVFVLGDNRQRSSDSRCHLHEFTSMTGQNAFVPIELIVGRAMAVMWPFDRWGFVTNTDPYESIPVGIDPAPTEPTIAAGAEARC